MSVFRHDPGDDGNLHFIQDMGHAVDGNGKQAGIGKDDFRLAFRCRIAFVNRLDICFDIFPDFGNCLEQGQCRLFGPLFHVINLDVLGHPLVFQGDGNLLAEIIGHIFDDDGQIVADVIEAVGLVFDISRINDPQQFGNDIDNDLFIRFIENVQFIDFPLPVVIVVRQDAVDNALYVF